MGGLDHTRRSYEKRYPLVQFRRVYFQNSLCAVRGHAAGLFNNKSEWITLVQKSKFAVWRHRSCGVKIHPAFYKIAVKIGN